MALGFVTERGADEQGILVKPLLYSLRPLLCSVVAVDPVSQRMIWTFVSLAKRIFFGRPCVAASKPLFWFLSVISAMRSDRRMERFTIGRWKLQFRRWPCRNKPACISDWT